MNSRILLLNFVFGIVFLTAVFHLIFHISLRNSILFATVLSATIDLAYVMHKKGILKKKKEIEVQNYWPKLALKQFLVVICSILISLCIGVEPLKALGVGSFFFIVAEMYLITLSPFIKTSHTALTIRRVLSLLSLIIGWYSLMNFLDTAIRILAGFATFALFESDRKVVEKLYELKILSDEDLRRGAEKTLMIPGLVLGSAIGWMSVKGAIFKIEVWRDVLPILLMFYPFFILFWYSIFQSIHWLRVYLHKRKSKSRMNAARK